MHLPGRHMTLISDQSPSGVATVTFGAGATLTQKYDDLLLVWPEVWSSKVSGTPSLMCSFNSDTTTSNYHFAWRRHLGSTVSSGEGSNFAIARASGQNIIGPCNGQLWIPRYTDSGGSIHTAHSWSQSVFQTSFGGSSQHSSQDYVLMWNSTNAITEIDLTFDDATNFNSPTRFLLYGISYERP